MKVGFYAGSFDPFTNGHLHVVKRSSELFDKAIIGIGVNSNKKRKYHQNIIKEAIEKILEREGLSNVSVILYSNLSIAVAKEHDTTFFIRGINRRSVCPYWMSFQKRKSGKDFMSIKRL